VKMAKAVKHDLVLFLIPLVEVRDALVFIKGLERKLNCLLYYIYAFFLLVPEALIADFNFL